MTKEIITSTIPVQIEKLKAKGLIISDEPSAIEALEIYGYYNVMMLGSKGGFYYEHFNTEP